MGKDRTHLMEFLAGRVSFGALLLLAGILLPVAVNVLVWDVFVKPPRKTVDALGSFSEFVDLKPRLEALVGEGHKLMTQRAAEGLVPEDADAILKEIRGLAKVHKVEVKGVQIQNTGGRGSASGGSVETAGFKKVSAFLEMTGKYSRIARWLASLDRKMEVQIDHFTLTSVSGEDCQLRLGLKILLRSS